MSRFLRAALAAALALLCLALPARATITTTANTTSCVGNGAAMTCAVPFKFFNNSDLVVTLGGVTQTIGTNYTVACAGCQSGGSVTMVANPANGVVVSITRLVPNVQSFNARSQGPFQPASYENAFDNLEAQIQQLNNGTSTPTILTDVPVNIGTTNQQGTSAKYARADHVHAGGVLLAPTGAQTISGFGNVPALTLNGSGSGSGITATGGATSAGVVGIGGSTSGAGGTFTGSAGNASGITATANGTGADVAATVLDARTATTMTIGAATATGLTLGAASYAPGFPGGLTVAASKTIDTTTAGALSLGATNATSILATPVLNANGGLDRSTAAVLAIGATHATSVVVTPAITLSSTLGVTGATMATGVVYANGGLDRSTAAALAIGATNATSVVVTPAITASSGITSTATSAGHAFLGYGGVTGEGALLEGGTTSGHALELLGIASTPVTAPFLIDFSTSDPSSLIDGDIWTQGVSPSESLKTRLNGVTKIIGGNPTLFATTTGQSIPSGVTTAIIYGTVVTNTDTTSCAGSTNCYNAATGIYTIPPGKGGSYMVTCSISWNAGFSSTSVSFTAGASAGSSLTAYGPSPLATQTLVVSGVMQMAAGVTLGCDLSQSQGVSEALRSDPSANFISLHRLSD